MATNCSAIADTISGNDIAEGIAPSKTEADKQAWWDDHMAYKTHEITGTIDEIADGLLSGYWVVLVLPVHNFYLHESMGEIKLRCGLSQAWKDRVKNLAVGSQFTCKGVVKRSWITLFGISFGVAADD